MKHSQKDTEESARRITRRGLILGGAQVTFMAVLGLRMRYMQVEQADQFRLLAEENRINIRLIPPTRGLIFDRNGTPLAQNEQNYRIVIVREDAGDVEEALARVARLVPLSEEDLARARKEIMRRSAFVPVTIADRLSWEEVAEVAVNAPALPGITPEVGLSRSYPMGSDFAHVIGYVGPVSDYDLSKLENPEPVLQIPRFQIGKSGVEAKTEDLLRGKAGNKRIEVNAVGRVIRELDRTEGQAGADLQLTIDHGLQNFMQARLSAESAAAVVLDLNEGDLLGIASSPTFDPNKFVRGISVGDYRELTENPYRPLANKTVQGTYPPGSTFKMVTALAALQDGVITPGETVWCPGYLESGGRRFHCWKRGGHGHVDLNKSLEQSCDVFFYDIARRVGIEKITAMANTLGLGIRHDLPMSAVAEGLTPTKDWKSIYRGGDWVVGDTLNAAIGQGFVLASPLQLAVMTGRIATGRAVTPRLLKSIDGVEQASGRGEALEVNPMLLTHVRKGMYAVSNSRRGTGYRTRVVDEAMQLAGKTGTSQVRNITAAERARGVFRNEDLPWNRRDHALFVCFAPYDNPRVAVSVVVEHGGGGSTAAAPVARDIALRALYGTVPPLTAYPQNQRQAVGELFDKLPLRDPAAPQTVRTRV
ncbi:MULTISPECIES: penicillin-binding protein 2 [Actibacterium]|uniref:Penicillin-binding protein 2 n=1 Tax=Actibacterium naphthalenivorans TaxID=1614693 RepID=A0A840C912_9RHOB|nr:MULTISPECIES: penicillin-binding protein 2 [Actibacterium]ALG90481.1 penicillin-binding protein [Actibacterium sp. EMB200-NS6]MBB4022441.1 penicillin-binding protein 2 [Actibacterium naphthalenivorans]